MDTLITALQEIAAYDADTYESADELYDALKEVVAIAQVALDKAQAE